MRRLVREEMFRMNEDAVSESDEETLRRLGFSQISQSELMLYQNNLSSSMTWTSDVTDHTWIVGATQDGPNEIMAFVEFGDGAGAVWSWDDVAGSFRSLFHDVNDAIERVADGVSAYDLGGQDLADIQRQLDRLGAMQSYM